MKKRLAILILLVSSILTACKNISQSEDMLSESEKQIYDVLIKNISDYFDMSASKVNDIRNGADDEYCFVEIIGKNYDGESSAGTFIIYLSDSDYPKGTMLALGAVYGENADNVWNSAEKSSASNENINDAIMNSFD